MKKEKIQGKTIKLKYPEDMKSLPISPFSGSRSEEFSYNLVNQLALTIWTCDSDIETKDRQVAASINAMMGVNPQDELEGMLAAQLVALHNAAMECYRRAMIKGQSFEGRSENLNQANKLSRSYATMMEALSRYRGKGQQKMIVEHVHVYAGGQAIVGNVNRPEGGGVSTKIEDQPHAKEITHAPMQEMPRQDKERKPVPVPRDAKR